MPTDNYVMGRTDAEARRLGVQADLYGPYTDYLLRLAGIGPGMRVLDVGCGPGDVTLRAARLVGPAGHVIGADISEAALATARRRAADAGAGNVTFVRAEIPGIGLDGPVDAVIGRLILMHLPDPVAAVRDLSALVRPGGIVSFQECDVAYGTTRSAPLAARVTRWCADAARLGGSPLRGADLAPILRGAGLEVTGMAMATPVAAGPGSIAYDHIASSAASLLPLILAHGLATEEEVGIGTLLDRLRAEGRETGAAMYPPELMGAWARLA